MIKRVRVTYHLKVDAEADRDAILRSHEHHARFCPVYRSLHPQIECTTTLVLEEV